MTKLERLQQLWIWLLDESAETHVTALVGMAAAVGLGITMFRQITPVSFSQAGQLVQAKVCDAGGSGCSGPSGAAPSSGEDAASEPEFQADMSTDPSVNSSALQVQPMVAAAQTMAVAEGSTVAIYGRDVGVATATDIRLELNGEQMVLPNNEASRAQLSSLGAEYYADDPSVTYFDYGARVGTEQSLMGDIETVTERRFEPWNPSASAGIQKSNERRPVLPLSDLATNFVPKQQPGEPIYIPLPKLPVEGLPNPPGQEGVQLGIQDRGDVAPQLTAP